MNSLPRIELNNSNYLKIKDVFLVATQQKLVDPLSAATVDCLSASRKVLQNFIDNRLPIYGVNTQFGDEAHRIDVKGEQEDYEESLTRRQHNLIRAHNCGLGEPIHDELVRATLLIRANSHVQGTSGICPQLVDSIIKLINNDCLPIIRRYGSVGASGDLVPLSAIALCLMGEGSVVFKGTTMPAIDVLKAINLQPFPFTLKDGLSIMNGTSMTTAIASMAVYRLCHLLPLSIAVGATCAEMMLAMDSAYHPFVHEVKGYQGQSDVARFIREQCWRGSQLIRPLDDMRVEWRDSQLLKNGCVPNPLAMVDMHVQDYYSLRCLAQGFGPMVENLERAVKTLEIEINSVNDNPIINCEANEIYHSGNFMTDYVAVICDHLRADLAKASTWLHALMANILHPRKSRGLPSNLAINPVECTAFKAVQLMVASIASHNRIRALPVASVMLPTEGDNQDMVGLGPLSAFDLLEVTENYARIIAAMLLVAAQALEIRGVEKGGVMAQKLHSYVRLGSKFVDKDRVLQGDLEALYQRLRNGGTSDIVSSWFL